MKFSDRLKRLRVERGWTQKELGDKLKISDRVIGYYESGDRFPKDEFLLKELSDLFNVSVDYLIGRSDRRLPANHQSIDVIPSEFTDPTEARKYVNMLDIFGSDGVDLSSLDDERIVEFANDLLRQIEMVSYKYKK